MPDPCITGAVGQVTLVALDRSLEHMPSLGETSARQETFRTGIKGSLAPFLCLKGRNCGETLPARDHPGQTCNSCNAGGGPSVALP